MGAEDDRHITDADRKCPRNPSKEKVIEDVKPNDLKQLAADEVIGKHWKVVMPIAPEKGFNTIFVVEHMKKKFGAAIKLEKKNEKVPMLKFELFVLLQMEQNKKTKQFCKVYDRGSEPEYHWIVISLCGKNLKVLRKEVKDGKFTIACGLSVALQCLKSIEEFHKMGYVHRSLCPSTYAIGRVSGDDIKDLRNIYLLDFLFAYQYKNADGSHKTPRPNPWKYIGKARNAPRNAYLNRDLSRADDLEMWLYLTVECVKGLPWARQRNPKDIFDYQKAVRKELGLREFLGGLPVEFLDILKEVDRLGYTDEPNYTEIYGLISNAIAASGQKEYPYDWEAAEIEAAKGGGEEEKKEEKDKK